MKDINLFEVINFLNSSLDQNCDKEKFVKVLNIFLKENCNKTVDKILCCKETDDTKFHVHIARELKP